jgi:hypothetical protein
VREVIRWRPTAEQLAVLLLGLLVLVAHDVGYMLRQSFWADEAWVAVSTRFPLSQLPATTSSSPIGWSALVRLVTVSGTQTARLLPAHAAPGGVILVSLASNWGFAYYWPADQPARRATTADMQRYVAYFPGQPRIVVANARDVAGVGWALTQALILARRQGCIRIWLVCTHVLMVSRRRGCTR